MRTLTKFCFAGALAVSACATDEEKSIGSALSGSSFGMPAVYEGDIKKKYSVLKQIRVRRKQICGPMYYDAFSGMGWMKAAGKEVGADAVINFGSQQIHAEYPLLSCGEFEAWGTAVKFEG